MKNPKPKPPELSNPNLLLRSARDAATNMGREGEKFKAVIKKNRVINMDTPIYEDDTSDLDNGDDKKSFGKIAKEELKKFVLIFTVTEIFVLMCLAGMALTTVK